MSATRSAEAPLIAAIVQPFGSRLFFHAHSYIKRSSCKLATRLIETRTTVLLFCLTAFWTGPGPLLDTSACYCRFQQPTIITILLYNLFFFQLNGEALTNTIKTN
jgi:hypothetical protein